MKVCNYENLKIPQNISELDYKYNGFPGNKINVKDLDSAINLGLDYGFTVTGTPIKLAVEYAWMDPSLDTVKNYQAFMATFTLPF